LHANVLVHANAMNPQNYDITKTSPVRHVLLSFRDSYLRPFG